MLERSSRGCPRTEKKSNGPGWRRFALFVPLFFSVMLAADMVGILAYPQGRRLSCRADTVLVMGAAQYDGALSSCRPTDCPS